MGGEVPRLEGHLGHGEKGIDPDRRGGVEVAARDPAHLGRGVDPGRTRREMAADLRQAPARRGEQAAADRHRRLADAAVRRGWRPKKRQTRRVLGGGER